MDIHGFLRLLCWFFFGVASYSLLIGIGKGWFLVIISSPILMLMTILADHSIWNYLKTKGKKK